MTERRQTLDEFLAGPPPFKKRPEPPKLVVVARTELSAETLRERASQAAREAAEQERCELARAASARQAKLEAFAARHWHAVEAKWHEQQSRQFNEVYRGFHSKGNY